MGWTSLDIAVWAGVVGCCFFFVSLTPFCRNRVSVCCCHPRILDASAMCVCVCVGWGGSLVPSVEGLCSACCVDAGYCSWRVVQVR